jgi:hypothetical protein
VSVNIVFSSAFREVDDDIKHFPGLGRWTADNSLPRQAEGFKARCPGLIDELGLRLEEFPQESAELPLSVNDHVLEMEELADDNHLRQHTNWAFWGLDYSFKKLSVGKDIFL